MARNRESQWAIGLASIVTAFVFLTIALFGISYLVGGSNAVSDNWVGFLGVFVLLGGLLLSLLAFILAVSTRIRHGRAPWLWLALVLFPALLAFIVLGEIFWWQ